MATEIGPPLTQEFPTSATELVLLTTRPWINGQEILEVRFQLKDHKPFGKIIGKRFPAGALVSAVAEAAEAAEAAVEAVAVAVEAVENREDNGSKRRSIR